MDRRRAQFFAASSLLAAVPAFAETEFEAEETWTVELVGRARVAVPPLLERNYERRRARIAVTPLPDRPEEWRIVYDREDYRCEVLGRGPRSAITLPPNQICKSAIDTPDVRGSVTVTVEHGALTTDASGVSRFEVRARVVTDVERHVRVTLLGRTFQRWVPVPAPAGAARYEGTTAEG